MVHHQYYLDQSGVPLSILNLKDNIYYPQVGQETYMGQNLEDGYFNIKVDPNQAKCMALFLQFILPMVMILDYSLDH